MPKVTVSTEDELSRLSVLLSGSVFRGHARADWALTSSLERAARRWHLPDNQRGEREWASLLEFQRRAHHYVPSPPGSEDYVEWLALLQHYGGPTRLLDVTHSLFVATFFALEWSEGEAAVWAFNTAPLTEENEPEGPRSPTSTRLAQANQTLASHVAGSGVDLIKPFRLNRRLADQQGAFLMPLSLEESLDGQLEAKYGRSLRDLEQIGVSEAQNRLLEPIWKLVFKREVHSPLLRFLSRSNISAATLFDGLDGFARSLHTMFRVAE